MATASLFVRWRIYCEAYRNIEGQSLQASRCAQTVRVAGANQTQIIISLEKCPPVFSACCMLGWYGMENGIALITQRSVASNPRFDS
jgi:hypothetical protein